MVYKTDVLEKKLTWKLKNAIQFVSYSIEKHREKRTTDRKFQTVDLEDNIRIVPQLMKIDKNLIVACFMLRVGSLILEVFLD